MNAQQLIDYSIVPLKVTDTGSDALTIMEDYNLSHLPIVKDNQLLGVISEDDILQFDIDKAIETYQIGLRRGFVANSDHLYEVLSMMSKSELTIIPVIDANKHYIGTVTQTNIVKFFAASASFSESGSIIILEINRRDYSLTEISRIVESEGMLLLSSHITSPMGKEVLEVTIKINSLNLRTILGTFERFKYKIKATFQEKEYMDIIQNRYDSLMNYLSI